jgi:hypothetical protein
LLRPDRSLPPNRFLTCLSALCGLCACSQRVVARGAAEAMETLKKLREEHHSEVQQTLAARKSPRGSVRARPPPPPLPSRCLLRATAPTVERSSRLNVLCVRPRVCVLFVSCCVAWWLGGSAPCVRCDRRQLAEDDPRQPGELPASCEWLPFCLHLQECTQEVLLSDQEAPS